MEKELHGLTNGMNGKILKILKSLPKRGFGCAFLSVVLLFIYYSNTYAEFVRKQYGPYTEDEFIQKMESPDRVTWQMPEKIVDYLAIKKGDIVADIGAGTGYFTVILSKKIGEEGKVYAVDIKDWLIDYIEKRVQKKGLNNIKVILSKQDDPLLPESSVDLVFMCNTYSFLFMGGSPNFIIKSREDYLKKLNAILKKGGRLAIVEIQQGPDAAVSKMWVPREKTMEEALKAGFKLEAEYFFLPYQYFLIFAKE